MRIFKKNKCIKSGLYVIPLNHLTPAIYALVVATIYPLYANMFSIPICTSAKYIITRKLLRELVIVLRY